MYRILKAELLKYGENTSVRGIPKFLKSKEIFLKLLWLLFFLFSTGFLTYMLVNLFTSYYSYPIITMSGEKGTILAIYRSPASSFDAFLRHLECILDKLKPTTDIYLVGDINVDLSKCTTQTGILLSDFSDHYPIFSFFNSTNLSSQPPGILGTRHFTTKTFDIINKILSMTKWDDVLGSENVETGQNITFPDITICNLDPFSEGEPNELSMENYLSLVKKYKTEWLNRIHSNNFPDGLKSVENIEDKVKKIFDDLLTVSGYLINLNKDRPKSEDCPNLVVDCSFFGTDWFETNDSCSTETFTRLWNANYLNCYTLQMSNINISNKNVIRGISLLLNVGPPNFINVPYQFSLTKSQARGVQVSVHSSGTPADLKRGFNVAPGTENIVEIVQTERKRIDKPHNKLGCTLKKTLESSNSTKYTQDLCVEYCEQKLSKQNSNCVSHLLNVPVEEYNTVVCGNLSYVFSLNESSIDLINEESTNNIIFSQLVAKYGLKAIFEDDDDSCADQCLVPCQEIIYDTQLTSATWPQPSVELDLFQKYFIDNECMDNVKVKSRYINYYNTIKQVGNVPLSNLTQIGESMLEIKFIMPQNCPYFLADTPAYTSDMMIGSAGGMLSLWLGITIASGVEFVEMVYLLIKRFWEDKNIQSTNEEKGTGISDRNKSKNVISTDIST
ncbi:hypothetical protein HELRODRAFT_177964 [Helobdella robusta]|uniref:Uncharacterized protein n=1 Tax=Helobdella robusta TaxID=6412 RepID=T1FCJ0_HELRO|nr:hypothetical protein HELRODRAFT_177964 [Helobdella robusta]ESN97533.1 hypothetical protein HELRODRAFT_177964 [Helobdella robusta]